jgi:Helix-turn-helix domain
MRGSFSRRLEWLERVALDPTCRGLPSVVAMLLAARYINSETGRAWPAQETLAKALDANRRSIQRALDALVKAGHLIRQRGGTRRQGNTYEMRLKDGAGAAGRAVAGLDAASIAASTPSSRRSTHRPNTGTEYGDERGEERAREGPTGEAVQKGRATLLPAKWEAGPAEFDTAQRLAGWDSERTQSEFGHFSAHHRAKGTSSRDWLASWEIWCRNGPKFEQRSKRGSSRTAIQGLQEWLVEQDDYDEAE